MTASRLRNWALAAALLGAPACTCIRPGAGPGRVHHVVLCWLKEPGNEAQRAQLIAASRELGRIASVRAVAAGPALASDRPVVDDSFDVAIHMVFRDAAALEAYEADPRHLRAVRDVLQPLAGRVVVYDFAE